MLTGVLTIPGRNATNVTSGSSLAIVLTQGHQTNHSYRRTLVCGVYLHRLFMAALPALYAPQVGMLPVAAPELMKTTRPPSELLRSSGRVARRAVMSEKKLVSKCCLHCSTDTSSDAILPRGSSVPALRMTPSMPLYFSTPWDTAVRSAAGSVLRSSRC